MFQLLYRAGPKKRRPKHQGELGAFWLVESQNSVSLEILIGFFHLSRDQLGMLVM